jgi:hypothetical protein
MAQQERDRELRRRRQRREKLRKLRAKLSSVSTAERERIVKKIHNISPAAPIPGGK